MIVLTRPPPLILFYFFLGPNVFYRSIKSFIEQTTPQRYRPRVSEFQRKRGSWIGCSYVTIWFRPKRNSIDSKGFFVCFFSWNRVGISILIDPYRTTAIKVKTVALKRNGRFMDVTRFIRFSWTPAFISPPFIVVLLTPREDTLTIFFFAYRENVRQDPFHFYGDTWWPASVDLILCLGQNGIFSFKLSYSFKSILTKVASTFFFP